MSEKKKPKIVWSDTTVIDALHPCVQEVLECVAKHADRPGAVHAFVSDGSAIRDFLDAVSTGQRSPHPLYKDQMVESVTSDTPENRELVRRMGDELGVQVGINDFVYEVAIKLRDRPE